MTTTETTVHHLKTLQVHFNKTIAERKPWEIRLNDRDFKTGDTIVLQEWNQDYTGREYVGSIIDVFEDEENQFTQEGYVIITHVPFED